MNEEAMTPDKEQVVEPLSARFAAAFIHIRGTHNPRFDEEFGEVLRPCAWCRLAGEQAAEALATLDAARTASVAGLYLNPYPTVRSRAEALHRLEPHVPVDAIEAALRERGEVADSSPKEEAEWMTFDEHRVASEREWLAKALIDATEDPNTFQPTEHPDYWHWVAETITSRHDWPGFGAAPSIEQEPGETLRAAAEATIEDARRWREAEAEGHIVDFTETGYGLQHPPSCRPDLNGCPFNRYLADLGYPDEEPGRYRMTQHKGHYEYDVLGEVAG